MLNKRKSKKAAEQFSRRAGAKPQTSLVSPIPPPPPLICEYIYQTQNPGSAPDMDSDRSARSDGSDSSDSYDDLIDLEPLPERVRQTTHCENLSGKEER